MPLSGFPCFAAAEALREHKGMAAGNAATRAPRQPARSRLARRTLIVSSIAIGCTLGALLLWYSLRVLLLIFAGILVAILLRALADVVANFTHLNHRWSLAVVMLVLVAALAVVGSVTLPPLVEQLGQVGQQWTGCAARSSKPGWGRGCCNTCPIQPP
jgi:hypothetical protein